MEPSLAINDIHNNRLQIRPRPSLDQVVFENLCDPQAGRSARFFSYDQAQTLRDYLTEVLAECANRNAGTEGGSPLEPVSLGKN